MDFLLRRRALAFCRRAGCAALLLLPVFAASCSGANTTSIFGCACPAVEDPVCGSDGITYENGCNAECAGAKIAEAGYCAQDAGTCSCPPTSDPVCGGNGVTYENACDATCAHQTISHAGLCSTTPDAGPDPDGAAAAPGSCSSQSCGPSQVCVDDGCSASTCTEPSDGGVCPVGFSYAPGGGSCGPVWEAPACIRACPATRHHCVDVPPTCSPASCSCLPADVCAQAGGQCEFLTNGIVECVSAAPAGAL